MSNDFDYPSGSFGIPRREKERLCISEKNNLRGSACKFYQSNTSKIDKT